MFAESDASVVRPIPGPSQAGGGSRVWERPVWAATVAGMTLLAIAWMAYQSHRYFFVTDAGQPRRATAGAIDVRNRFDETRSWFQRESVYGSYGDAVYPPATYAMLRLVFNAMPWAMAKPLWFVVSLVSVGILSWQLVRFSLVQTPWERWFVAVLPWAMYATGAALGNGQFVLFVVPMVLNALLLLAEEPRSNRDTWMGTLLILGALIQPTIAAPFFWLILFRVQGYQPALRVVGLYLLLTAVAVPFQVNARRIEPPIAKADEPDSQIPPPINPAILGQGKAPANPLLRWFRRGVRGTYYGSVKGGYGSVHDLLVTPELAQWNLLASLGILGALGLWIFLHRRVDLWLLLGVTAIVARVWIYHRWYDDLLMILPLITLCRLTRQPHFSPPIKTLAAILFLWLWMFLLAPGVLYTFAKPQLPIAIQVTGWLATLVFLALLAARERRGLPAREAERPSPASPPVSPLPV
ncbi:MAG: hypothetical protein ACK50P_03010 [Planctomycetaceae bacterium]